MNRKQPAPPTPSDDPGQAVLDCQALLDRFAGLPRVPTSTYRLQLGPAFGFRQAADLVPYLARLGIGAAYCSPYLQARPGSPHGYDICDHQRLNEELGTPEDYQAFTDALAAHGLGQVLDIVPNHMAADPVANPWWRDVLENGQASAYARYFDIDWTPVKAELHGQVLLPILGDHYGHVLDRGELQLAFQDAALVIRYANQSLPVDPRQWPFVLRARLDLLQAQCEENDPHLQEFLSILSALDHLPPATAADPQCVAERKREKEVARNRLRKLLESAPLFHTYIETCVADFNGQVGHPESFDRLHDLLERLPYRLSYWKTASHEINYRRFFDINELAGLRMEEPEVFAASHALVLRLVSEGKVSGLRLDHPDGLFDPGAYAEMLQEAVFLGWAAEICGEEAEPALLAWRRTRNEPGIRRPLYVVAEKILEGREPLPDDWPLHGTSGYDFLNSLNRLFVDPAGWKPLRLLYEQISGRQVRYADLVYEGKKLITATALSSELNVLAHTLNRISEADRHTRDFTLESLREALSEVVACFPVYRTYVSPRGVSDEDRRNIELAVARAKRRNPAMEPSIFDFVESVLLAGPDADPALRACAMKVQQYTGPVHAKGVEDTVFYRYNVLLSLNEVGSDPQHFGGPPVQFHDANRRRLHRWPHAMLATATHDHKRGEDARARLNVLSEMPQQWGEHVQRWLAANASHRTTLEDEPAPDPNDEYFFYQTLLAVWPPQAADALPPCAPPELVDRLRRYMTKAIKEAKVHTSWIHPNEGYDQAVAQYVQQVLTGPASAAFLADFVPFARQVARLGMLNSLSQVVLKIASPGVPDFYQGCELWDLSLVDPDNRRPVDYALRRQMLRELEPLVKAAWEYPPVPRHQPVSHMLAQWHDGRIKMYITMLGLHLRKRAPKLFQNGDYLPLEADGSRAAHVLALARRLQDQLVVAAVPRLVAGLTSPDHPLPLGAVWADTTLRLPPDLPARCYQNLLTGETIHAAAGTDALTLPLADLFATCPVALLVPTSGPGDAA
ncbi:MAG: malto-oligosyltrehalose synthase [Pirellulales bacterium]|nr:malto-oligosyltrehalose synthase [Pirellulales bacterium]